MNLKQRINFSILLFIFVFSFSFFTSLKEVSAIGFCVSVGSPSITVDIAGQSFSGNGSITVDPGTVLDFYFYTYADPSSLNGINYPYGKNLTFPGPSAQGRKKTTDPINSSTYIYVWIVQNCLGTDPETAELTIAINVSSPSNPSCSNGATNPPACDNNNPPSCSNGATNPPACDSFPSCNNGATNPPACNNNNPGPSCPNGATNPPACNDNNNNNPSCPNGATNPPACNNFPSCGNGATNPPICNSCPSGQILSGGSCVNAPVDGYWSGWGDCSVSICGRTGTHSRSCTPPQYGGTECSQIDGGNSSGACSTPACPTGNISATSCTIPGGAATCNSFLTWNAQNLTGGATEVTRNNPRNTHVSFNTSGSNFLNVVNYNASTFFLYHNLYGQPTILAQANVNASCSSGTIWDGTKCKSVPGSLSGTLIPTNPPFCNISNGADSCTINFTWETVNPPIGSISAVTSNRSPNFIVANKTSFPPSGYSGTKNFNVKHGIETFYLYNSTSTRELAQSTVAGVCASGTAWDLGSNKCKTIASTNCGNGIVEPYLGEQCDDGNQYNGQCPSLCSIACTWRTCTAPGDTSINVHPNVIVAGGSSILTWGWDGGGSCTGTNFNNSGNSSGTSPIATSGSITVSPTSTITYTINCSSATAGSRSASAVLTVKKKPVFIEN